MIARLVSWLLTLIPGKVRATNDGYWGGVTMWDRLKAVAARRRSS